jgi:hypothetical protein
MTLKYLLLLVLVLAPAPFPSTRRQPPLNLAGTWQVKWGASKVELELRPDSSGQFRYANGGGTYNGTWRYDDPARTLYLTLDVFNEKRTYIMTFKTVNAGAAAGRVKQGPTWSADVSLSRRK